MASDLSNGIPVPFTETTLRVSPWLGELQPEVQWLILALSALVPLALVLWLYRYEMRLVTRGAARFLLALRVAVIALVWFVVCLQPVLVTTKTTELPSRVVVALDLSESMSATDPGRPAADKLRLARALHLPLPGGEGTAKLLEDWIRQYDQLGKKAGPAGLEWVNKDEFPGDEAKRRELAQERRALHDRICAEVNGLTRLEICLRLLKADGGSLLNELKQKHQVDLLGFQEKVEDLQPEQLDKLLQLVQDLKPRDPKQAWEPGPAQTARLFHLGSAALDKVQKQVEALRDQHPEAGWVLAPAQLDRIMDDAEGKQPGEKTAPPVPSIAERKEALTDLTPPLERSLKPGGRGRLIGVVLLTDGQHNAPSTPSRPAERLGKRQVPIFPVVLGTTEPRPSVTVAEVEAPPRASSKEDVTVRVRFRVTGLEKQNITVALAREDHRAEGPRDPAPIVIAHNGQDQYYDKSFVVSMDPKGKRLQSFTLSITPQTRLRAGVPTQQVTVKLDDTRARVLIVDGEARWEYHYLANALLRDPGLEVERVVFDLPLRDPNLSDEDLKKLGNPVRHLPKGPDALADYQCIILGDVSPEQLPPEDRRRLEEFVSKHGGTLVVVAGKRFTPLAYRNQTSGKKDETDPLLKLLPIEEPRVVDPAEGFHVTLTPEGKNAPFLHMEPDPKENEERWAAFPPHYWAVVGRAKPAATALAYYRDPTKPAPVTVKDREQEEQRASRDQALIARHHYGRGQVLYVGLDSTWRWRYRVGDTYHHRFWGQVLRWASSDYVRFGTDKPVYQEGQDVNIDLTLRDKEVQALPKDGEVKARILRVAGPGGKDKNVALVPLSTSEGLRVLKGRVRNLPAGRYRIELDQTGAAKNLKLGEQPTANFRVTPRENREMDHLEANVDLLRDLAQKSGNKDDLLTPASAAEVVQKLTQRPAVQVERSEQGLWQREWGTLLLVVFLGLVSVEWVTRKWAGLP